MNQTPFRTVVLQGAVVDDPDINKDTKLLDGLSSIIGDAEVSTVFIPHMQKFPETLASAKVLERESKINNEHTVAVLCQRIILFSCTIFFLIFLFCFHYKL